MTAVYAMALVCLSVRLSVSVCPLQIGGGKIGVLLKRQNTVSRKQHLTIAHGIWFSDAKDLREIRPASTPAGAANAVGLKSATFNK